MHPSSVRRLAILVAGLALAWIMTTRIAVAAELVLTPSEEGKVPAPVLRQAERGEAQGLLVLFDDAAIRQEVARDLGRRRLAREDAASLALKATRYRELRQRVLPLLTPEEGTLRRDYSHLPMALIEFRGAAGLKRLLARKEVRAVYPDRPLYAHLAQSLPLIGQPSVAQAMGRAGAGTTVAVVDTGLDYTRAEFGSCTAPGVPAGCRVAAAVDIAADDGQRDDIGHGTWVSGTVVGVAPGARIAALDVFAANGTASSSTAIGGINWAIANRSTYNIVAINMSLGDGIEHSTACTDPVGPAGDPFYTPINDARAAGMVVVASSGNEGYSTGIASPACVAAAVAVGAVYDANVGSLTWSACSDATTAADKVTCFSNSASLLDLLAPGALITVTGATVGGTSFSAPHVAGAVAVLKAAFPGETPAQIENRLTSTGKPVTDTRNGIVKPRLDVLAAQGAPDNDLFAAAAVLTGTSGQTTGWNLNAGKEAGEPGHAGNSGGKSVWWQWTAPEAGQVTLDTHGSGFNTLLAVYTGASVGALTSVAGNDNDGSGGNTSGLSFHATSGTVYRIAVDGYAAAAGAVTLNWSFTADPPQADLQLGGGASPDPATAGSSLTYSLSVVNQGPAPAAGATLTVQLDLLAAFASASPECANSGGTVTCSLGTLTSGAMKSIQIVVTPAGAGTVGLSADVSASTADPVAGNNALILSTTVQAAPPPPGNDSDTDVPLLPPWAMALLGSGLMTVLLGRRQGR